MDDTVLAALVEQCWPTTSSSRAHKLVAGKKKTADGEWNPRERGTPTKGRPRNNPSGGQGVGDAL